MPYAAKTFHLSIIIYNIFRSTRLPVLPYVVDDDDYNIKLDLN